MFFRIQLRDKGIHGPKHHHDDTMYIIRISFLREWARKVRIYKTPVHSFKRMGPLHVQSVFASNVLNSLNRRTEKQ
jgi:hypothetical protein